MLDEDVQDILNNHIEDIIIVSDKNGYINWANKYFEELTGFTLEEVKGLKAGTFLQGEETDQETVQKMRHAISVGKGFNVNVINYSKSGRKYWLNINCSAVYDKNNELESFIAIERDITTEHQENQDKLNGLIKELQKMSSEKSELIEMIYLLTHDLKAPLNNIDQLFEIITGHDEEIGRMIKNEISRSKTLINKILSNGNDGPKKINLEISDFNILDVIENLHEINKINLTENKLSVFIDCLNDIILHSDKVLITQVLENLFINAIKYSNPSSQINFEVEQDADFISIVISNETDSLEEWQLSELFKPFQNFSLNGTEESTGIGSFIVTKYLSLVSGEIEVSKIDKRVFFTITLKKTIENPNAHLKAVS